MTCPPKKLWPYHDMMSTISSSTFMTSVPISSLTSLLATDQPSKMERVSLGAGSTDGVTAGEAAAKEAEAFGW